MSQALPEEIAGLGVPAENLPRHIAIIMDGNGRWAAQRGLPRIHGHERGADSVRTIVTHCARLGIEADALQLQHGQLEAAARRSELSNGVVRARYLIAERDTIMDNNVRFSHIGRRENLPQSVLNEMDETVAISHENTGLRLNLALNYGSREEIVDAARAIATEVSAGRLNPSDVDEALVSSFLYTADLPDPDLLIRTANERRLSNFLLWQVSYAEIHITPKLWPDFGAADLNAAIIDFASRERRFGGVTPGIRADAGQ